MRRARQDVLGSKGMVIMDLPATLSAYEGGGDRAYVAPGALSRSIPLVSPAYLLTLAYLFGRLLAPMPKNMLEESSPWRP